MGQLIEKLEEMIERKAEFRVDLFEAQGWGEPREAAISYYTDQLVEKLDELID